MRKLLLMLLSLLCLASAHAQDPADGLSAPTDVAASGCSAKVAEVGERGGWHRQPLSDTVIVFVHGILSDSRAAWLTSDAPCAYWPNLVASDARFGKPGIFLGGYYSKVNSGSATIRDVAGELFATLATPSGSPGIAPIAHRNIIFVAHSLGGVVVRRMLVDYEKQFAPHRVALLLYASPAGGSPYADVVSWLATLYPNSLVKELKSESASLAQLNEEFAALLRRRQQRGSELFVVESFESRFPQEECSFLRFIFFQGACRIVAANMPDIVPQDRAGYFAGVPRRLPNTDHLTIVKPRSMQDLSHSVLYLSLNSFGSIPAQPSYSPQLGRVTVTGRLKSGRWETAGAPTDAVVRVGEPCGATAICNERIDAPQPYGPNPADGDQGFVILHHETKPILGTARVEVSTFPAAAARNEQGQRIFTAAVAHVAASAPDAGGRLVALHTITMQPMRYRVTDNEWKSAPSGVPAPSEGGDDESLFELKVPASILDGEIVERGVAGEVKRQLADLVSGMRMGVLEYRERVLRGTEAVYRFMVKPRIGEIR